MVAQRMLSLDKAHAQGSISVSAGEGKVECEFTEFKFQGYRPSVVI